MNMENSHPIEAVKAISGGAGTPTPSDLGRTRTDTGRQLKKPVGQVMADQRAHIHALVTWLIMCSDFELDAVVARDGNKVVITLDNWLIPTDILDKFSAEES